MKIKLLLIFGAVFVGIVSWSVALHGPLVGRWRSTDVMAFYSHGGDYVDWCFTGGKIIETIHFEKNSPSFTWRYKIDGNKIKIYNESGSIADLMFEIDGDQVNFTRLVGGKVVTRPIYESMINDSQYSVGFSMKRVSFFWGE